MFGATTTIQHTTSTYKRNSSYEKRRHGKKSKAKKNNTKIYKNVCIATYIKQYPKRGNCQKIMIYVRFLSFFFFSYFILLSFAANPMCTRE